MRTPRNLEESPHAKELGLLTHSQHQRASDNGSLAHATLQAALLDRGWPSDDFNLMRHPEPELPFQVAPRFLIR